MGITSSVGLFSGIDSRALIDQLLQIEARPKFLAQQRLIQLQTQQSAYLDINTRLGALKTAAASFRTNKTFDSRRADVSNDSILSVTAGASAVNGSYTFLVDRLVNSQQFLSRGFADLDTTGLNAGAFTFESADARLDRDIALADLNGGSGVDRGSILITEQTSGNTATIDLSRVVTVNDVLDKINNTIGVDVTASISGGKLVITQNSGDQITIADVTGDQTATSLGIEQATFSSSVTGSSVYFLTANTSLASLNDGNGVFIEPSAGESSFNFQIAIDGQTPVTINISDVLSLTTGTLETLESGAATVGDVLTRINDALTAADLAGIVGAGDITAQINANGTGIDLVDSTGTHALAITESGSGTSAKDLGILGTSTGSLSGDQVLAGLNSTLIRNINGGNGLAGDGLVTLTSRDGITSFTVDASSSKSLQDVINIINNDAGNGGKISASLNDKGTGLLIQDTSGSTAGNLIVTGTSGNDSATSLGIATVAGGVAADSVVGTNLQHSYVTPATLLSTLNDGRGIGTGTFRITDSLGNVAVVDIASDSKTIDDIIDEINSRNLRVNARINDTGDGITIEEDLSDGNPAGSVKIKIEDASGSVAKNLNILGEATGTDPSNFIDGSYEKSVTFDPTDTLQDVISKINSADVGVAASVINAGAGSSPFRLNLTSTSAGVDGRFIIDTGSFDLSLTTISDGNDAVVFFGSGNPADDVQVTSSSNTLDNFLTGVTIDLNSPSTEVVTVSVSTDNDSIEASVEAFLSAFNEVITRIDFQTRFIEDTEERGALLGDSTALGLRDTLYNVVFGEAEGLTGSFSRLADVGVTVGDEGVLTLNKTRLRQALEEDFNGVRQLFEEYELEPKTDIEILPGIFVSNTDGPDTFSSIGVAGLIEQLGIRYTDSIDGILTNRKNTIDIQITNQEDRIKQFDERLASRRTVLERQFLQMEQIIGQLSTQQSSLGQIAQLG